jgi:putative copper export protein
MGIERSILVILHILGASIWIGGMLIMALGVLPKAKKTNDASLLKNYEGSFHILGMIALTIQFLTGFRLAMIYAGGMKGLFDFSNHAAVLFMWKLVLILATMGLFVVFKKKTLSKLDPTNVSSASAMIWVLTLLSLGLMILGLGFSRGIV